MIQSAFFEHEEKGEEQQRVPGPATGTGADVNAPTAQMFVETHELYGANPWGDLLRLVAFHADDLRLVTGPGQTRLLLWNRASGMWCMQGRGDFQGLADAMLAEANETALEMAKADPTVGARTMSRLGRWCASASSVSATRALKSVSRLAMDPTVQIPRVDAGVLNRVIERPVLLASDQIIGLTDGAVVSPGDLQTHYLLDMTSAPTSYVPDAADREAPGAVMMGTFLRYLGNGNGEILTRRLGWQLCGPHGTLDVIAGDHGALHLLARALRDTLGPSGVHILSMARGTIRARDIAHGMEESRMCVWLGADTPSRFPVWEVNDLICQLHPFRQGNMLALVADWPRDWDALDHRIATTVGWAWRVHGWLVQQGIDVDALLDQDGREYLLAALIRGAVQSSAEFQAGIGSRSAGDPGSVAGTQYSRACAEDLKLAGSSPVHRVLYQALDFTSNADDVMTMADIDDAISAVGGDPVDHAVVGRALRVMCPGVESGRDRIDGTQTRVVRGVSPRSEGRV